MWHACHDRGSYVSPVNHVPYTLTAHKGIWPCPCQGFRLCQGRGTEGPKGDAVLSEGKIQKEGLELRRTIWRKRSSQHRGLLSERWKRDEQRGWVSEKEHIWEKRSPGMLQGKKVLEWGQGSLVLLVPHRDPGCTSTSWPGLSFVLWPHGWNMMTWAMSPCWSGFPLPLAVTWTWLWVGLSGTSLEAWVITSAFQLVTEIPDSFPVGRNIPA